MLLFDAEKYGDPSYWAVSPDVTQREYADNGFSAGWGAHFPPIEDHFFDAHCHMLNVGDEQYESLLSSFLQHAHNNRVRRHALIIHYADEPFKGDKSMTFEKFAQFYGKITQHKNICTYLYMHYTRPDIKLLEACHALGIRGIKLHNAPLICDAASPAVYQSPEWQACFDYIQLHKLPILWHVVQRKSASTYTGSPAMSFWREGEQKNIQYGNEQLLSAFLDIVERYPSIPFIAAHQLHLSFGHLTELFERYDNLYSDTTVGCTIDTYDSIPLPYRIYYHEVFETYADRLLFGTDTIMSQESLEWADDVYKMHIRFLKQIFLTQDTLDKVAWKNSDRLFGGA